jgi:hypothetical protein
MNGRKKDLRPYLVDQFDYLCHHLNAHPKRVAGCGDCGRVSALEAVLMEPFATVEFGESAPTHRDFARNAGPQAAQMTALSARKWRNENGASSELTARRDDSCEANRPAQEEDNAF